MLNEKQVKKLKKNGINDINTKNKQDFKTVTKLYIDNKIDKETFEFFSKNFSFTELFQTVEELSHDNKDISVKAMEIINNVVLALREALSKAETEEERSRIMNDLMKCIDNAKEESESARKPYGNFIAAAAFFLGVLGLGFFLGDKSGKSNS